MLTPVVDILDDGGWDLLKTCFFDNIPGFSTGVKTSAFPVLYPNVEQIAFPALFLLSH